MASLKRIAAEVGVSYTLVSKVLSGRMGTTCVSAKTRAAIVAKALELNYTPNRLAVALKAGRKGTVGVFLHGLGNPGSEVADDLLRGLAESLDKCGLHMWLRFFESEAEFVASFDSKLRSAVDGVILAGIAHPELAARYQDLGKNRVPVVCGFNDMPEGEVDTWTNVAPDVEMQGYLPTKHMLDMGRRNIACLATTRGRTLGYQRALREAGRNDSDQLIFPCLAFGADEGEAVAKELMRKPNRCDGIVCQSDSQALGAINALIKGGLRVPEDVMVSGVDDSPMARTCIVPVTSVTSEMKSVGRKSVHALLEILEGRSVKSIKIEPALVARESTGLR